MLPKISKRRSLFISFATASVFPLIVFQLIRLTVYQRDFFVRHAARQHNLIVKVDPERGLILDRNLEQFTMNLKVPSVGANPRAMEQDERKRLAGKLASILALEESFVEDRLSRNKAFIWLKRRITREQAEQINNLVSPNLEIRYEMQRFYPQGNMLANVLGFCDIDNIGIEGLELHYHDKLKGRAGHRSTKRDARGREVVALQDRIVPAVDGANLILTIDQHIQFLTEQALDQAYKQWKAKGAMAIVMNPKTGEILAMASRPTFDPNDPGQIDASRRRNRAVTDIYEPGSVFKIITIAAALAEQKVTLGDQINCEQGEWRVRPKRVIHDVHPYGWLSVPDVLVKSSNIGTVKVAMQLGERELYRYIKRFAFGESTGIDFPGEVSGILRPVEKWSKYSISSIPYGQEVAATPIQMIRAAAVIANGGYLVQPYLLNEIRDSRGVTLFKRNSVTVRQILPARITQIVSQLLERAVIEGTGKRAAIDGVRVAGKTGTTQKLEPNGTYSHNHFVASFVGFAPVEDPRLIMIVGIDDPTPYYYGGTVAAPVFKEVIERSLFYLGYVPYQSGASHAAGNAGGEAHMLRESRRPGLPAVTPQAA